MIKFAVFILFAFSATADVTPLLKDLRDSRDLEFLLIDLINRLTPHEDVTCIAVVCDTVYLNVFEGALFWRTSAVPVVMIVVEDYEDLLSPNFDTLESLREVRKDGCNIYIILLANGLQTTRLLRFGDRHRILDTRAKYIMLYDVRLFHSELHYIWKRIVNVIFLRYHQKIIGVLKSKAWFDLSTVPYPNPIRGIFVPRRVDIWNNGRFHYNRTLFAEKTRNLNGEVLNVVYLEHVPSVVVFKNNETSTIGGVEIEILNTLSEKMNFKPKLYQPINAELHKWGQKQPNGSFSGLLGEMLNGNADLALGNLQYTPYHLELTDMSIPYTSQCWTFLTPEALTDNSWKTLILPFKDFHNASLTLPATSGFPRPLPVVDPPTGRIDDPHAYVTSYGARSSFDNYHLFYEPSSLHIEIRMLYMWITVLLVLLITGVIFYGLANFYMNLEIYKKENIPLKRKGKLAFQEKDEDDGTVAKPGLYLFGEIINSILYTYGMLLVVSLPKLPSGWSIRLLTGWYWLYCILLVVSYRASMTAILANPAPRVTIDTLKELVDSKVTCGGWGTETKKFFEQSLDDLGQKIGARFETIDDPEEAARKVAQGVYAYYDNSNFLKYLSVKRRNSFINMDADNSTTINGTYNITVKAEVKTSDRNLHIMSDCVVNIPISLGFHKNSPLKPLADTYVRRIVEVGLVEKWLSDAMHTIRSLDTNSDEIKALMNLKKLYGAFVALGIGYFLSAVSLIGELIHWHLIVKRDPKFDKYALDIYYMNKNKKL